MIKINFPESKSEKAFSLFESKKLGEKKDKKIIYSKYEAIYLLETKKAEIINKINLNKKEKLNYLVFKDLREKGYIVKTGNKFGADFRVYKKQDKHARFLVHVMKENEKLLLTELISKNRISKTTNKKTIIAIIDSQEDITYSEFSWIKP